MTDRVCKCGHSRADQDRWGKGACTPWLRRESDGVIYVGKCDCKEADYTPVEVVQS
jgi:hypothetical protein